MSLAFVPLSSSKLYISIYPFPAVIIFLLLCSPQHTKKEVKRKKILYDDERGRERERIVSQMNGMKKEFVVSIFNAVNTSEHIFVAKEPINYPFSLRSSLPLSLTLSLSLSLS
jgi:hypothetical protein